MADSPKRWGFVCAYCFLEVGDYSAVRFSHRGEPVVYSDMLAASHVMACPSFQDRRAYYKCLACYENHQDLDFPSASAFEKHMQTHPGYSFVKNESEVSEATRNKIEYYVLKPELEELMAAAADDGADGYSDEPVLRVATHAVDISPISSPELSTRQSTAKPAGVAARGLSLPVDAIHAIRTPVPVRAVGAELPTNPYSGRSVPSEMQADQDGPAEMSADNFPGMPSFYGSPTNFATQPAAAYDGRPEPETLWPRVAAGQGTAPEDANLSRSPVPLAVRPSDVERTPSRGSTTSLSAQAQAAMPRTATQPVAHTQEKLQQGQRLSSMNSRPGYSTQNSLGNKEASGKKGFRDRLFNN
ncbi:hypothetical protein GQ53DRAFT_846975 [Thozetella sp. PMI_491]|nr:hypothetical protein GQ53DRAFT_846975 [Thozetella sp. PMI_491]